MQQHIRHLWAHLFVLCSLGQEGGVAGLRGQIFSSKSGILWIYGAFKTTHDDVSDLQGVALEKGLSS
jgi:hypothetical protein